MFVEVFMFLYYAAYLGLGYGVPIVLAAMAFVSGDKSRMSRWLIHFLILNVLEYTVFPILDFIGLSILSQTLGVLVLFLPIFVQFESVVQFIQGQYNDLINPQMENLRVLTLGGLQKLNLA